MAEVIQYYGTGRRKTAIARVYLRPGSGAFKVNGREFEEYFVTPSQRVAAKQPLASTETGGTFNVLANVSGDIPVNEWVRVRVTDMEQFQVNFR